MIRKPGDRPDPHGERSRDWGASPVGIVPAVRRRACSAAAGVSWSLGFRQVRMGRAVRPARQATDPGAHTVHLYSLTLLALATTALSPLSSAEDASAIIIVTAERTDQDLWRSSTSTGVITDDDVRLLGTPDTWTAPLRLLPGVDVIHSAGGLDGGGLPTLRLRGTASNADTAVVVDGVPWVDPTTIAGEPIVHTLDLPGISQVEVVRGPQSGLHGSRAVGGVVHVRSGEVTDEASGAVRLGGGSFGTRSGSAHISGPLLRSEGRTVFGYQLAASASESEGISALVPDRTADPSDFEPDGHWRTGLSGRLVYAPTETIRLHVGTWIGASRHDFDRTSVGPDDLDPLNRVQQWRLAAGGAVDLPNEGEIAVDLARTVTERDTFYGVTTGEHDYVTARVLTVATSWLRMQLGLDLDHQRLDSETIDGRTQSMAGVWLQALTSGEAWEGTGVVRQEDFSNGDAPASWKVGGAWLPGEARWRLHASVGSAYRAPSLFERYADFSPFFAGNPDLLAQTSVGWDAGVGLRPSPAWELALVGFGTHYRRRIVGGASTYLNESSSSQVVGTELATTWREVEQPLWTRLAATWQDSEGDDGQPFLLLPEWKGSAQLGWETSAWWTTLTAWYVGERTGSSGSEELDAYLTLDLAAGWRPRPWLKVIGRVDNLLDESYVTNDDLYSPFYYSGIPRAFSLALEGHY